MKLFNESAWTAVIILVFVGLGCIYADLWHPTETQNSIFALTAILWAAGGRLENARRK